MRQRDEDIKKEKQYQKCLYTWDTLIESNEGEYLNRLDRFLTLAAFNSVKLEYQEFMQRPVSDLLTADNILGYSGSVYPVIVYHNHAIANKLFQLYVQKEKHLTSSLILDFHEILAQGMYGYQSYVLHKEGPGKFKQLDIITGVTDSGSSPEEVAETLEDLIKEMPRIAKKNDILVAASYFHARFKFLSPFSIGTDILDRFLTNYFLVLNGHPPVLFLSSTKEDYLTGLEQFDVYEDIDLLVKYFRDQIIDYWSDAPEAPSERRKSIFKVRY